MDKKITRANNGDIKNSCPVHHFIDMNKSTAVELAVSYQ